MIKILKNELKQCIAPEEQTYYIVDPHHLQQTAVEVLPNLLPVYANIPCSNLPSPCQLENPIGKTAAPLGIGSNPQQFPSDAGPHSERDSRCPPAPRELPSTRHDNAHPHNNSHKTHHHPLPSKHRRPFYRTPKHPLSQLSQ